MIEMQRTGGASKSNFRSYFPTVSAACLAAMLVWTPVSSAADSPQVWLERMSKATTQVSYQGTLIHTCDGVVDVVHIVHRIEDGRVTQRITSRDPIGREIIRNPEEVMCVLPDQSSVVVETQSKIAQPEESPIGKIPSFTSINSAIYRLAMMPPDRVAGRDTEVVVVRPVDEYRYGYRLWLDRERSLALKFELIGETGETLEQILFEEIQYSDDISAGEVRPSVPMDALTLKQSVVSTKRSTQQKELSDESILWQATELPPGFALTARRAKMMSESGQPMEQLVYSDGVGSVSVFIEDGVVESEQVEGISRFGATNAYTTTMEGRLITAVGYVPIRTVRMIALSVMPVQSSE